MSASSLMRSVQSREHSKASAVHEPPLVEDAVFDVSKISQTEVFNSVTSDCMSPSSGSLRDSSGGHTHASQSHAMGENAPTSPTSPTSREVGLHGGSKSKFKQQPLCCKALLWCFRCASLLSDNISTYNLEPSEGSGVSTQERNSPSLPQAFTHEASKSGGRYIKCTAELNVRSSLSFDDSIGDERLALPKPAKPQAGQCVGWPKCLARDLECYWACSRHEAALYVVGAAHSHKNVSSIP